MNSTPLEKMTRDELEAELGLYRSFEDIEVPAEGDEAISNNEKRIAFLTALRQEHGFAHQLTEEDIKRNPALGEEAAAGDIVLLTSEEVEDLAAKAANEGDEATFVITQEDLDAHPALVEAGFEAGQEVTGTFLADADVPQEVLEAFEAARKAREGADAPPAPSGEGPGPVEADKGGSDDVENAPAAEDDAPIASGELVFRGRTVHEVRNKIIGGRLYKEVDMGSHVETLTEADFAEQVRPRESAA